jgi:hypothetical protein
MLSWICVCDFFFFFVLFVSKSCLQTALLLESDKELRNQLLTPIASYAITIGPI